MNYEQKLARDCYQQVKTLHRLLLNLADDLGDLSAMRSEHREFFATASDMVSGELEPKLMQLRDQLGTFT